MYNSNMLRFKTSQNYFFISLFFIGTIILNISYAHAEMKCSISKNFSITGLNCWFKSYVESSDFSKQHITKKIELHFGKMTNDMVKKLPQESEFKLKVALKSLFEHKIIFLLKDIDKVLNSITFDSSLKTIIEDELIKIDQVILNVFQQYNKVNTNLNKYVYVKC